MLSILSTDPFTEKVAPTDPVLAPYFEPWREWFDKNVERVRCVETVVLDHEHGFAGRVDMVAKIVGLGWCVVDFKTQKVKRGAKGEPKPAFYESWPLQLAAYREPVRATCGREVEGMVSVVIDSVQPGPVHTKVWGEECEGQNSVKAASEDYFKTFLLALKLWKFLKGYDPVARGLSCEKPELN